MKSFFQAAPVTAPALSPVPDVVPQSPVAAASVGAPAPSGLQFEERVGSEARVAVYDSLTASPRMEVIEDTEADAFIETLAARVFGLARELGGSVPFTVIRELAENFVHAAFREPVVTILDSGNTIRFSDQGPGIADKERAFLPGFSTASREMKRVIKGVGSGLPIVRECIGYAQGSIEVEDNLGGGTVVTVKVQPQAAVPQQAPEAEDTCDDIPRLSTRQKQVVSLVMERGEVGPTLVAQELKVGLSTAYRDLAALEGLGLLEAGDSGKRTLSRFGIESLDKLLFL